MTVIRNAFVLGIVVAFVSCNRHSTENSQKAEQTAIKANQWIDVAPSDLYRISQMDSAEAERAITEKGFIRMNQYLFVAPWDTTSILSMPFIDIMLKGRNAIMRMDKDITYVFPINKLSYFKSYILSDSHMQPAKQETKFNDRSNNNYINEWYHAYTGYGFYSLTYSDSFGKITVVAQRIEPIK